MSFKIPKKRKILESNPYEGLPIFDWNNVKQGTFLGSGSYGKVVHAEYFHDGCTKEVVLKLLSDIDGFEKEFIKEAKLLHMCSWDPVKNIVKFLGISRSPPAIMQELCMFDFKYFGDEKKVSNLSAFCQHIDSEYSFEGFAHIPEILFKNICCGLQYLHSQNIVHRDIKPANILVSNLDYNHLTIDEYCSCWQSSDQFPIIAKLTDFGESRSNLIQTMTIVKSKIYDIKRGTYAYMSPEILLEKFNLQPATLDDLKKADLWALGLVIWYMLNPSQGYPFKSEIEKLYLEDKKRDKIAILKQLIKNEYKQVYSEKYTAFQNLEWVSLINAQKKLNSYKIDNRIFTLEDLITFKNNFEHVKIDKYPLKCSQNTSLESYDHAIALGLKENNTVSSTSIANDGTNSCSFLCLKIADEISKLNGITEDNLIPTIIKITENIITAFPSSLNVYRDIGKCYDATESNKILFQNKLISRNYSFTEEILTADNIAQLADGEELICCIRKMIKNNHIALYTCVPIIILLVSVNGMLILIDTHPVSTEVGGNGTGLITSFKAESEIHLIRNFLAFLQRRMKVSVIEEKALQSMALLNIDNAPVELGMFPDTSLCFPQPSAVAGSNDEQQSKNNSDTRPEPRHVEKNKSCPSHAATKGNEITDSLEDWFDSNKEDGGLIDQDDKGEENAGVTSVIPEIDMPQNEISCKCVKAKKVEPLDGILYRDDPLTPVFVYGKDIFEWEEIIGILLTNYPDNVYCVAPPVQISHNVYFLINVSKLKNVDDYKCDDMGAWKHNGVSKPPFTVDLGDQKRNYIVTRCYYKNKSSPDFSKVSYSISTDGGEAFPSVLVNYRFKNNEHVIDNIKSHGNSKKTAASYRRTQQSMLLKLKDTRAFDQQPKKALDQAFLAVGDIQGARSVGELPRNPQQLYDARRSNINRTENENEKLGSWKDELWQILQEARDDKDSRFVRDCRIMNRDFYAVLANDRQLKDLEICCCNPEKFSILQFDPTFNIFSSELSLTVSTYRNLKLLHNQTNKHPVFIGPLLLHQDKSWKTYSNFANTIITENPALSDLQALGTDGEKALSDGLKRNFSNAVQLRCFIHVKKNIEEELKKRKFNEASKRKILRDIFGSQDGTTKYLGLVDARNERDFDDKLAHLQESWESIGSDTGFYQWFNKYQSKHFKESMLLPIRQQACLGDQPKDYTNNDVEAGNFMIKYSLKFEKVNPGKFIQDVKVLIEQQQRDMRRAIISKGPYKVANEFSKYAVDDGKWIGLSKEERERKENKFLNATLPDTENLAQRHVASTVPETEANFDNVLKEISGVPKAILDNLIKDAKVLVTNSDAIVRKPLSTTETFIVGDVSTSETICVRKDGDGFVCSKNCRNSKLKICSHTLAVAQRQRKLDKFIKWFSKRKPPEFSDIVLANGRKGVGSKKNQRKRSNYRKKEVTTYVDALSPDLVTNMLSTPYSNAETVQSINIENVYPANDFPYQVPSNLPQSQPVNNFAPPQNLPRQSFQTLQRPSDLPAFFQSSFNIPAPFHSTPAAPHFNNSLPLSPLAGANIPIPSSNILNDFSIKFVGGTHVSSCYGCSGNITNPPISELDKICVVHRGLRYYYNRVTGLESRSNTPQNLHFHPFVNCIRLKYGSFKPETLIVPRQYLRLLSPEIIQHLCKEFSLNLNPM